MNELHHAQFNFIPNRGINLKQSQVPRKYTAVVPKLAWVNGENSSLYLFKWYYDGNPTQIRTHDLTMPCPMS